ncbi:MAG: VWA domain-containing protein [Treponema sp.]|nr:VWA domain-containing protein [Treponema sp.]
MIPEKYNSTKKETQDLLIQTYYQQDLFDPSIAFTTNRTNNLCGSVYKVFVNNSDKDLSRFLELHELGHIIFGHVKNNKERMDKYLLSKITIAYSKISKYFPNFDTYLAVFKSLIFNIVMDFEVNSRLFNESEWEHMNEKVCQLLKQRGVKGLHPKDYGYPLGLHWNQYLTMIIMEPEEFLKKFRQEIYQKLMQQMLDPSSPSSDSTERIEKLRAAKEAIENNRPLTQEELSELESISKDHNESSFHSYGPTGHMEHSLSLAPEGLLSYSDMKGLLRNIIKVLQIEKINRRNKRDLLYNYNRRKVSTKVLVPKYINNIVKKPGKLIVLMDVSGSMDTKKLFAFVKLFKEFEGNYDKVNFITWDTQLIAEWAISEAPVLKVGGGTNIGPGINYVGEKYKPGSNDTFFVISDFWDRLSSWESALSKLSCKKYAINWDSIQASKNPGFIKIFQYAG